MRENGRQEHLGRGSQRNEISCGNEITKNMAGVVLDRVTVSQEINLQKMMESDTEVLNG